MSDKLFEFDHRPDKFVLISPKGRDFQMYVAPRYRHHYVIESYEKYTSNLILNCLQDKATFIDIGANYGYYSILAAKHNPKCRVIAYEPVSSNFMALKKSIEINRLQNVELRNNAVSDTTETKQFQITEASDSGGFYTHPSSITVQTVDVQAVRLDEHFGYELGTPVIIKIDTEGHELSVLNGMKDLLQRNDDVTMFIEFNPLCLGHAKIDPQDLLKKIDESGFDIYIIAESQNLLYKLDKDRFSKWEQFLPADYKSNLIVNLMCLKKNRSVMLCMLFDERLKDELDRDARDFFISLARHREVRAVAVIPGKESLPSELEKNSVSYLMAENIYDVQYKNPVHHAEGNPGKSSEEFGSVMLPIMMHNINPDFILDTAGSQAAKLLSFTLNKPILNVAGTRQDKSGINKAAGLSPIIRTCLLSELENGQLIGKKALLNTGQSQIMIDVPISEKTADLFVRELIKLKVAENEDKSASIPVDINTQLLLRQYMVDLGQYSIRNLANRDDRIDELERSLSENKQTLKQINSSFSWRITAPLRLALIAPILRFFKGNK